MVTDMKCGQKCHITTAVSILFCRQRIYFCYYYYDYFSRFQVVCLYFDLSVWLWVTPRPLKKGAGPIHTWSLKKKKTAPRPCVSHLFYMWYWLSWPSLPSPCCPLQRNPPECPVLCSSCLIYYYGRIIRTLNKLNKQLRNNEICKIKSVCVVGGKKHR